MQAVAAQRQPFREHDAIRNEEAAVHWQAWQHHEQLQQWHGVGTRQMADERAELLAQAPHYKAAADSLAQRQAPDARCIGTAFAPRCE